MSNIRNYIHHSNRPDAPEAQGGGGANGGNFQTTSTRDILSYLFNLRPPAWTVLGGAHATGVSRLLEELERQKEPSGSNYDTIRIVLPDDESKPKVLEAEITRQMLELFKDLRRVLQARQVVPGFRNRWRSRRPVFQSSSRDPKFENLFGDVRELINHQPVRRIVLDNAHYVRQDTQAVKRLFQLRRVVTQPFTIIFGLRLEKRTTENSVQLIREQVPGAEETFGIPQTLFPPAEDQLTEPILFELLRGQYAMPADDLIAKVPQFKEDLKQAVARNWVRLDVLAMKIDEKLRKADPQPRTQERPGVLTYQMLREILDEMLLRMQAR